MKWITPAEAEKKGFVAYSHGHYPRTHTQYDGGHNQVSYRVLTPLEAALVEMIRSTGQFESVLAALEEAEV